MNSEQIAICINEYGDDIYRFCCFLTGSRDLADELYQESFLKAIEKGTDVNGLEAKNFLIGIAVNLWKNMWRKEKRRQKIIVPVEFNGDYMSEPIIENSTPYVQNPLDSYISNEMTDMVSKVVNELPDKYRIVVLMYYSVDMTTQEIADELHISKGTVTSRLKRARDRIKKSMEDSGYEI